MRGDAVKTTDGAFVPVPLAGRMVRLSSELLAYLGFAAPNGKNVTSHETLLRLANAGFVEMLRISSGVWLLDLDSWFRHLKACMDDPFIWDEGSKDRAHYLKVNVLGGWKHNVGKSESD